MSRDYEGVLRRSNCCIPPGPSRAVCSNWIRTELKAIAANPNRSRPVGYAGVSTADQNLALPEVADRSRMRKRSSLSMSPALQSIDPPCSKR